MPYHFYRVILKVQLQIRLSPHTNFASWSIEDLCSLRIRVAAHEAYDDDHYHMIIIKLPSIFKADYFILINIIQKCTV